MAEDISVRQILQEYRNAYPELRTLTDTEILSVLNDSVSGIKLSEEEQISTFGLQEQGYSGLTLEQESQNQAENKTVESETGESGSIPGTAAIIGGVGVLLAAVLSRGKIKSGVNKLGNKIFPKYNINGISYRMIPFSKKKYRLKLNEEDKQKLEFVLKAKRTPNPHPANLTKELERVHYSRGSVKELLSNNPELSPIVGSLPQKWGRKLASKEGLEEVDKIFYELSGSYHAGRLNLADLNQAKINLSQILGTEVKIEPLGAGNIGMAFKLTAYEQDFVLKCFRPIKNEIWQNSHGNFQELCSALYASKHDPNHFAKFYMGRFGQKEDGYILTKFLEGERPAERAIKDFSFKKHSKPMSSSDTKADNMKGSRIIDYGAANVNEVIIGFTKEEKKLLKLISEALDSNNVKQIDNIIAQYGNSAEFTNVKKYIQLLVNQHAAQPKYGIDAGYTIEYFLERKVVLEKIGVSSIPSYKSIIDEHRLYNLGPDFAKKYYNLTFKEYRKFYKKYQQP